MNIKLEFPMRLENTANRREHYMVKAKRAKSQRMETLVMLRAVCRDQNWERLRIKLTRIAPSKGLDYDGLVISLKHVVDGIADYLGVNDKEIHPESTFLRSSYHQERRKPKEYAVRIEIEDMS